MSEPVRIPNGWSCRPHQRDFASYLLGTPRGGRAILIWHRRAGKDSACLNLTSILAHRGTPGTYWHLLPTQVQARKVVWNALDGEGRRLIDQAFPPEVRDTTSSQEMFIRLKCGSAWQLGGSDNYNALVGANVRGVIFSEWALCDPQAWTYIRPILRENGGWAVFITTPRGRNHAWEMHERAKDNDRWFSQLLSVEDTARHDGTRIITEADIDEEREDGMSQEMIEQEYFCSFAAGMVGSYFGRAVELAREEGRIGKVPHDRRLPVHLYFDLGIDDSTAIWFGQRKGFERRWFRYEEHRDIPISDIFDHLAALPYRYGTINLPHDGGQREKYTGKSGLDYAHDAFGDNGIVVPHQPTSLQDQIEWGRFLLSQSWFDDRDSPPSGMFDRGRQWGCRRGLDCLASYRKIWDEKRRVYQQQPHHDWASHGASAFMLAGQDDNDQEPVHESVLDYVGVREKARVIRSL